MSTESAIHAANPNVDTSRRRFLTLAASGMGVIGGAAVVWPLLASLRPSAKAQAAGAPITIDLSVIEPGQKFTTTWRGKAIWVVKRTPEMVASLTKVTADLVDPDSASSKQPDYAKNGARAIKPEISVLIANCTHLGCIPTFRPDHPAPDVRANWEGGFYCPCHGSKFDLAGRVFKGSPAPVNLSVPPYRFASDSQIVVGEDQAAA